MKDSIFSNQYNSMSYLPTPYNCPFDTVHGTWLRALWLGDFYEFDFDTTILTNGFRSPPIPIRFIRQNIVSVRFLRLRWNVSWGKQYEVFRVACRIHFASVAQNVKNMRICPSDQECLLAQVPLLPNSSKNCIIGTTVKIKHGYIHEYVLVILAVNNLLK